MNNTMLSIHDLTFKYPESERKILDHISFDVEEGSITCICGLTGSGKTTLLRSLKRELQPKGIYEGSILLQQKSLEEYSDKDLPFFVGYVGQNPEHECVTDKVSRELAFGLENMGKSSKEIQREIAEISAFFGIDEWYDRETNCLSGGQKQLLLLAAALAMKPMVLLLDEPTSQLDPIAQDEFIHMLRRVKQELGTTIILVEQRLERILPVTDQVLVLDHGKLFFDGKPEQLREDFPVFSALPCGMQAYLTYNKRYANPPMDIPSTRQFLKELASCRKAYMENACGKSEKAPFAWKRNEEQKGSNTRKEDVVLQIRNLWASYEKKGKEVIRGLNLSLYAGQVYCLIGGNGSGKTSTLRAIAGQMPYTNQTKKRNYKVNLQYLPQDVETVFWKESVKEELADTKNETRIDKTKIHGKSTKNNNVKTRFNLENMYDMHPYDLSGGEKQKLAINKIFAKEAELYLLDEPAKGMDEESVEKLVAMIREEAKEGKSFLIVTHDLEFAAQCGDVIGMFFQGKIVAEDVTSDFFQSNQIYTTDAFRATRGIIDGIYHTKQLLSWIREDG